MSVDAKGVNPTISLLLLLSYFYLSTASSTREFVLAQERQFKHLSSTQTACVSKERLAAFLRLRMYAAIQCKVASQSLQPMFPVSSSHRNFQHPESMLSVPGSATRCRGLPLVLYMVVGKMMDTRVLLHHGCFLQTFRFLLE